MVSNQCVVGLSASVGLLELRRRGVAEVAVEALVVVPVHPAQGGQFDVVDAGIISTTPSADFGTAVAWPDSTARAAASASPESDLPLLRRARHRRGWAPGGAADQFGLVEADDGLGEVRCRRNATDTHPAQRGGRTGL